MSASKYKYFMVTSYRVVRANNQTEALAVAAGQRGVDAQVLSIDTEVNRITASEAHSLTA